MKEKLRQLVKDKKFIIGIAITVILIVAIILTSAYFTKRQKAEKEPILFVPTTTVLCTPTSTPALTPTPAPTSSQAPTPPETPTPGPTSIPTPVPTIPPTVKPTLAPTAIPTPVPTAVPKPEPTVRYIITFANNLNLTVPETARPGETVTITGSPDSGGTYTVDITCPGCEVISTKLEATLLDTVYLKWSVPYEAQPGTATIKAYSDVSETVYKIEIIEE